MVLEAFNGNRACGKRPQNETAVAKDAIGRGKLDYFVVYEVIMSSSDKSRSQ